MNGIDISIIIVNHNSGKLLADCLASIKNSKLIPNIETIIVDNNSTDKSIETAKAFHLTANYILNLSNEGFSKANNMGIKLASGKYILLLNPDVVLEEDTIKLVLDLMESRKDIGIAGCKLVKRDGKLDLACRRGFPTPINSFFRAAGLSNIFPKVKLFSGYNLTYLDEDKETEVDSVCGAFMMIRKAALDDAGLLDEDFFMYGEDLDLCYRFKQKGWKIYYYPKAKALHYKGISSSKQSEKMIDEFFNAMKLFYKKHYFYKNNFIVNNMAIQTINLWRSITKYKNYIRPKKHVTP